MHFIFWKGGMTSGIIWLLHPYNLPCRKKKSKHPFLLRHLYRYLETVTDCTMVSSLVQRRVTQLQQSFMLRDSHPFTSHAGVLEGTLCVSAWHHASQPKNVVSIEHSSSSCLVSPHPHPKLLVAFYNEPMEQVPAKWTADYTWNRLSLSFPRVHSAKSETALADGKGQTISQASVPLMKMQSTHSEPNSTAGIGKGELGGCLECSCTKLRGAFFTSPK